MTVKSYTFTEAEMMLIRDALFDAKDRLRPADAHATPARLHNYAMVCALAEQFKTDVRLIK